MPTGGNSSGILENSRRPSIRLLAADPELGNFLQPDDRAAVESVVVPVRTISRGTAGLDGILADANAVGAILLDGMIVSSLRLSEAPALRVLGPGDMLVRSNAPAPVWASEPHWEAAARTRLALLGEDFLLAARRWPRLVAGLNARLAEQIDRVVAQMAICQLPRVDQRILAMLWLLAESWGQVTTVGTLLPLSLTHDALGGLVGARRPTVTLALGELTERGALVRQDQGWLLLEQPSSSPGAAGHTQVPGLLERVETRWRLNPEEGEEPGVEVSAESPAVLRETLGRLREQHQLNVARAEERLEQLRAVRKLCAETRAQIVLTRRRAPS